MYFLDSGKERCKTLAMCPSNLARMSFRLQNDYKQGKYKPDIFTLGSHNGLPLLMTDKLGKPDELSLLRSRGRVGRFSRLLGACWVAASDALTCAGCGRFLAPGGEQDGPAVRPYLLADGVEQDPVKSW